jgi:DUF1009 family protein
VIPLALKRLPPSGAPVGLLAGGGEFPRLLAEGARRLGRPVFLFGLKDLTDRAVDPLVQEAHYFDLAAASKILEALRASGVRHVLMGGSLPKKKLIDPGFRGDGLLRDFFKGSKRRGDDGLLRALEVFLRVRCGISVLDSRLFLKDVLCPRGVLTRRKPTASETSDLRFGLRIARGIGKMDIGQTVVVKEGVVLAVEAIEGTDLAIRRGGELGYGDCVVVKASKPNQDLRFDLPCIGVRTLETLRRASSKVIGLEAGKTILIGKQDILEAADEADLTLVGL